ncbi:MAG: hypothetical protein IJ545_07405 [Alphaproteobacteria bacterium]|nr:hypothetical protein [Alphaproteobacteria bacterium]
MRLFNLAIIFCMIGTSFASAEVIEADDDTLSIYGEACEPVSANEQNASTRLKATDKACYSAVSSLSEIVNIKDSFDEHDYNMLIYTLVDEYIEDMTTKTTKQDSEQICIEVTGYVTPENIGKAIDETIQSPQNSIKNRNNITNENTPSLPTATPSENKEPVIAEEAPEEMPSNVVILSTVFVKPTEFYNNTVSNSHSALLKDILSKAENVKIVNNEEEANFVVTPKVLKAKIESLNSETNRMQMVIALDTFDRNQNSLTSEHQNKFVLFNNTDDEQAVAKQLLKDLMEQGSISVLNIAAKSDNLIFKQQAAPILSASSTASRATTPAGADVAQEQ